jgi:hypothetical protein
MCILSHFNRALKQEKLQLLKPWYTGTKLFCVQGIIVAIKLLPQFNVCLNNQQKVGNVKARAMRLKQYECEYLESLSGHATG